MIQQDLFDAEEIQIVEQKPTFDKEEYQSIVLKSNVKHDEYTDYIQKKFDLQINDVSKVCIPNKLNIKTLGEWNIGVICGASGSGKSTILKHLCNNFGGVKFLIPLLKMINVLYQTLII